ncbi:MAG: SAM-dependent methyltransferase [Clostridia bacterium]|nr:SAM-dependent methyltransferase [Clostridia bacterium]
MSDLRIRARLLSAASLVRQGALFADIGTDHAYLPIFLLKEGKIDHAIASDINEGPLSKARENVASAGLSDKVDFFLCDGARALCDSGATDYAVCGMGGELIADIIRSAEHLKSDGVRLILQPMTREGHLRRFLYENGFDILSETYSYDSGKYYVTLCSHYTGTPVSLSESEYALGREGIPRINSEAERGYLQTKQRAYERAAVGKSLGGESGSVEREIIELIKSRLEALHK